MPRKASKPAGALCAAAGFTSAVFDLIDWMAGPLDRAFAIVAAVVSIAALSIAGYVLAMSMIAGRMSVAGYLRFAATGAAMFLPFGAALAFGDWAPAIMSRSISAPLFIALLMVALAVILLLPAWPVAAARLSGFVSPIRVLAATRGHRWQLLITSGITGAISRWLPKLATANNAPEAGLLFFGHGVANAIGNLLAASLAAAAWAFAIRNDPTLG